MSTDFVTLCEQAERSGAAALDNLRQIESALGDLQKEMGNLPFFVRGFVTSEVKKGTGQDVPAWAKTVNALTAAIREAQSAVERARPAGTMADADRAAVQRTAALVEAERGRLDGLLAYMRTAPVKIQAVPGGMLPAERRGELLAAIDRQVQAMRGALAAMPELAESLNAIGRA